MLAWPDDLVAETQLTPHTLCRLYVVEPVAGTPIFLTDHDEDITVDDQVYLADKSFEASAIQSAIGGSNQNLELTVLFGTGRITFDDAQRGAYQGATLTVYLASWGNPGAGKGLLGGGRVGSFSLPSNLYGVMTVVGSSGKSDRTLTEVYTPTCRADFGDTRCTKDLADFSTFIVVSGLVDDMTLTSGLGAADGLYNLGSITWTSGDNDGYSQEVMQSYATGVIKLFAPPLHTPQAGDTATIFQGCAKTVAACTAYNNLENFRGEPYVPGDDYSQVL